jgi:hypothetical protein
MKVGTLKELNVKPGDVVECVWPDDSTCKHTISEFKKGRLWSKTTGWSLGDAIPWRIVSRASDTPKIWRDMTDEEKGALLLAHHEGKVIELYNTFGLARWVDCAYLEDYWNEDIAYRVKPKQVRGVVKLYWFDGS